jgi:hypothetical protein
MYTPEEGRHELRNDFYDLLQNIYDNINKK